MRTARYQRHRFRTRYTPEDIALLAEVDRTHERLSGPATRCILQREYEQYAVRILGFHVDNGSEYINHRVAKMLEKPHVEFTKCRACRSQDNALVEGKNGAVVGKLIGYGYMAGEHAEGIGKFYAHHLNPYLNFHRPCGFATVTLRPARCLKQRNQPNRIIRRARQR